MLDFFETHDDELRKLCREFRVRKLELFGSAATGRFDSARSDVDFLVDFEPMPPSRHARSYFGLLFALEELCGRKIDLVETPAVTNPYFLRSVDESRIVVYAA